MKKRLDVLDIHTKNSIFVIGGIIFLIKYGLSMLKVYSILLKYELEK